MSVWRDPWQEDDSRVVWRLGYDDQPVSHGQDSARDALADVVTRALRPGWLARHRPRPGWLNLRRW
jgi:hypothetical protein